MAQIGWGKNRHGVRDFANNKGWRELPTPAEDTWEVTTEKGDKLEAKLEGGKNQDVKYKENTNTITFDIRVAKGEKKPFADKNGIIANAYEYFSQPEDPEVPAGIMVGRARISCEVKASDAEGMTLTYTVEPLEPADKTKDPMQMGKVTITEAGGKISDVTIEVLEAEEEPEAEAE